MGKPNKRHHELCQHYKQTGRRELNKAERAKRNQRRIEKFVAKREARGEVKNDYVPKPEDERGDNRMPPMGDWAWRPKMKHMLPIQKEISFMRRLQNQIDAEDYAFKHGETRKSQQ